jgi:apolipoprotein N-acyltransferase
MVEKGADILVNITNDAWYGWSSAAYQHLALGVMRSVETRRFTIRATNTGISAFISPTGAILMKSPMFEKLVMVGAVNRMSMLSAYVEYGNWFAWGCVAYTLIGMIVACILRLWMKFGRRERR